MERKVTTVKMVYATQVINASDDYPSPSQFEEWKLQAQQNDFSKSALNLPKAVEERIRHPSVQLTSYDKCEPRPAVIPELEILEDTTKYSVREPRSAGKSNIFRSARGHSSTCTKANCSTCNKVSSSHMKSSSSLANVASDIVVVSAGWFSSLRRTGRRRKKNETGSSVKAKSAWDLSNIGKLVCFLTCA